eukprot:Colp12_sorted_trinity150504_noHs@36301
MSNNESTSLATDFWTNIKKDKKEQAAEERTLFFVGSKRGGKTTVRERYTADLLESRKARRPDAQEKKVERRGSQRGEQLDITDSKEKGNEAVPAGLDYAYNRTIDTKDDGSKVSVTVHVWELAGGLALSKLISVPLNAGNLPSTTIVATVDLSSDCPACELDNILSTASARVKEAATQTRIDEILEEEPGADTTKSTTGKVSWVILGTKYDIFMYKEPQPRKQLCRYLRLVAMANEAGLMFSSERVDHTIRNCVSYLREQTWGDKCTAAHNTDYNEALFIRPLKDSLSALMDSKGSDRRWDEKSIDGKLDKAQLKALESEIEACKKEVCKLFHQKDGKADNNNDVVPAEPEIDALQAQKKEELGRLKQRKREATKPAAK